MAWNTVAQEITRLEAELATLDTTITNQQSFRELEEGGAGSRFRTQFTAADALYKRRDEINARLTTLRMGS